MTVTLYAPSRRSVSMSTPTVLVKGSFSTPVSSVGYWSLPLSVRY